MARRIALMLSFLISIAQSAHAQSSQTFCFEEAGKRYGIAPQLLWGIAKNESSLNPAAVNWNTNGTYDYGVMQINSSWEPSLRKMGVPWQSLSDACTNVMAGAWILRQCIDDFGYNWNAIGCYNSRTPSKRDAYARRVAMTLARYNLVNPPAGRN